MTFTGARDEKLPGPRGGGWGCRPTAIYIYIYICITHTYVFINTYAMFIISSSSNSIIMLAALPRELGKGQMDSIV